MFYKRVPYSTPQDLRSTDTREQFKRRLKSCLSVRMAGGASDRH